MSSHVIFAHDFSHHLHCAVCILPAIHAHREVPRFVVALDFAAWTEANGVCMNAFGLKAFHGIRQHMLSADAWAGGGLWLAGVRAHRELCAPHISVHRDERVTLAELRAVDSNIANETAARELLWAAFGRSRVVRARKLITSLSTAARCHKQSKGQGEGRRSCHRWDSIAVGSSTLRRTSNWIQATARRRHGKNTKLLARTERMRSRPFTRTTSVSTPVVAAAWATVSKISPMRA